MFEVLELGFFQRALMAGLLASVACGIIGSYVVVKRMASISGGLAHAAFGGVGIGYFVGFSPLLGAAGFALASALVIGVVYRQQHHGLDTLIAMIWSLGMAVGVIFVGLSPGYAPDLTSYLFGSILFVPTDYVYLLLLLDVVVLLATVAFFQYFQAVSFDEEFAEVSGVPVDRVLLFLLALTALTVVMLIRVVGVIMVIALLTTPAVVAGHWSNSLKSMMFYSVIVAAVCTVSGLFLSNFLANLYNVNIATGPLIILITVCCFIVSAILRAIKR